MSTLRVWLAFLAPLVVLGIGNLAARRTLPAEPLTRTMLGGCVRLSGPIRSTLRGIGHGLAHAGRFALVGWVALIVVAVVGWFVVAAVVSTVTVFSRPIIAGWVALVALAGLKPAGRGEGPSLAQPLRHVIALRRTFPAVARAEAEGHSIMVQPRYSVNEHGDETVVYRLPVQVTAREVVAKREAFVHALNFAGVASDRWVVAEAGEVGRLRVTILAPPLDLSPRKPDLSGATDWRQPFVIGRDQRGRDVTVPTYDNGQIMAAGMSSSGKTVAVRVCAAHFARDPHAILWLADGKGDYDDWEPLRHRAERFVSIHDQDAGTDYLAMLDDLLAEVRRRNRDRGRHHPGMLVLLEEATQLRAYLTGARQNDHDRLLRQIVQTCRSANVLVVVVAQKPSSKQWDTDARSQQSVALCMRVENAGDARMVLGSWPEDDDSVLRFARGHGLLKADGRTVPILVDYLDNASWSRFCASLPAWQDQTGTDLPGGPQEAASGPQDAPRDAPAAEVEPDLPPGHIWMQFRDGSIAGVPGPLFAAYAAFLRQGQPPETICTDLLPKMAEEVASREGLAEAVTLPEDAAGLGTMLGSLGVETRKRTLPHHPAPKRQARWVTRADVEVALDMAAVHRYTPADS